MNDGTVRVQKGWLADLEAERDALAAQLEARDVQWFNAAERLTSPAGAGDEYGMGWNDGLRALVRNVPKAAPVEPQPEPPIEDAGSGGVR